MTAQPVIVTMQDVRAIKGCSRGARAFCQRHEIDWPAFLQDGIDASILDATGDHMALRLTAEARRRAGATNG